jgi:hypothetical protein
MFTKDIIKWYKEPYNLPEFNINIFSFLITPRIPQQHTCIFSGFAPPVSEPLLQAHK